MKTIPLSQGLVAFVDDEDFKKLSKHKWYARRHRNTFYGMRNIRVNGRVTTLQMHRAILNPSQDEKIDHRDGNGLNNVRGNLRIATNGANRSNARRNKNNTSGFKGVSFFRPRKTWIAYINAGGERIYLGYFKTPQQAHKARCAAALKHHGEFARIA